MKVLVVKMSSMGDVIHCLPAVTDLIRNYDDVQVDWVVEEHFADLVDLHPQIKPLPVAIRRWRSSWWASRHEVMAFRSRLKEQQYEVVIDAQGLIKSALVALMARGEVAGFDRASSREPAASLFYRQRHRVAKDLHAIERQRQLFAAQFDYEVPGVLDYGLHPADQRSGAKDIVFIHGTTWASKHWPLEQWQRLASLCTEAGFTVRLPWFTEVEKHRAEQISHLNPAVAIEPSGSLRDMAKLIGSAAGAVAVDTGLAHLAAAFNRPLVTLYGPTSAKLTGVFGPRQVSLAESALDCAPCLSKQCRYKVDEHSSKIYPPCFAELNAERVFEQLQIQLEVCE